MRMFCSDWRLPPWLVAALLLGLVGLGVALGFIDVRVSPFVAFLLVVSVPVGVLILGRPNLGLLLVVFLIPLEDFNALPGVPESSLSLIKLVSIVVFGIAIVDFLVFRREERLVSAPQNWLILLLLAAIVFSGLVALSPMTTLVRTLKLVRVVALYGVIINMVRTEADLRHVVWVFLVSGLLCAVYGIYNQHFRPEMLGLTAHITGTMDDHNEFAAAMVARVPLLLFLLVADGPLGRRLLLGLTTTVLIYAIFLSGSRGGAVALLFVLGLSILRQKRRVVMLLLLLVLASAALIGAPRDVKERFYLSPVEYRITDFSTERRLTYQRLGLELLQEFPVAGIGLDGFPDAYARSQFRFMQTDQRKRAAHNMYLDIATGTGLLGLVPFLGLLSISLYDALRASLRTDQGTSVTATANGVFVGLGGFLVASLFLSEQYEETLWLLIALSVVLRRLALSGETRVLNSRWVAVCLAADSPGDD